MGCVLDVKMEGEDMPHWTGMALKEEGGRSWPAATKAEEERLYLISDREGQGDSCCTHHGRRREVLWYLLAINRILRWHSCVRG